MAEKFMVPSSRAVQSIEEIAVQRLSVLKAQIPVDGRKKAEEVTFANTTEEAKQKASRIFGTDLRGYVFKDIQKEYFLAVTYDTAAKTAFLVFSAEVERGYGYHAGICKLLQPHEV